MLIDPWHGTYDDVPEHEPSFVTLLSIALAAWVGPVCAIVWVIRRLR